MAIKSCQVFCDVATPQVQAGEDARRSPSAQFRGAFGDAAIELTTPHHLVIEDGTTLTLAPGTRATLFGDTVRVADQMRDAYVTFVLLSDLQFYMATQQDLEAIAAAHDVALIHYAAAPHLRRYQPRPVFLLQDVALLAGSWTSGHSTVDPGQYGTAKLGVLPYPVAPIPFYPGYTYDPSNSLGRLRYGSSQRIAMNAAGETIMIRDDQTAIYLAIDDESSILRNLALDFSGATSGDPSLSHGGPFFFRNFAVGGIAWDARHWWALVSWHQHNSWPTIPGSIFWSGWFTDISSVHLTHVGLFPTVTEAYRMPQRFICWVAPQTIVGSYAATPDFVPTSPDEANIGGLVYRTGGGPYEEITDVNLGAGVVWTGSHTGILQFDVTPEMLDDMAWNTDGDLSVAIGFTQTHANGAMYAFLVPVPAQTESYAVTVQRYDFEAVYGHYLGAPGIWTYDRDLITWRTATARSGFYAPAPGAPFSFDGTNLITAIAGAPVYALGMAIWPKDATIPLRMTVPGTYLIFMDYMGQVHADPYWSTGPRGTPTALLATFTLPAFIVELEVYRPDGTETGVLTSAAFVQQVFDSTGVFSALAVSAGSAFHADGTLMPFAAASLPLPAAASTDFTSFYLYAASDGSLDTGTSVPVGAAKLAHCSYGARDHASYDYASGAEAGDGGPLATISPFPTITVVHSLAHSRTFSTGITATVGGLTLDGTFVQTDDLATLTAPAEAANPLCPLALLLRVALGIVEGSTVLETVTVEGYLFVGTGTPTLAVDAATGLAAPWTRFGASTVTHALAGYSGHVDRTDWIVSTYSTFWPHLAVRPYRANPTYALGVGAGGTALVGRAGGALITTSAVPQGSALGGALTTQLGDLSDATFAEAGKVLPLRFNGSGSVPAWANGAIIWPSGPIDTPYLGCCGDGSTGVYAIDATGALVYCSAAGADYTVVRADVTAPTETVLLVQLTSLRSGESAPPPEQRGVVIVHGSDGFARTTTVGEGPTRSLKRSKLFAWATDEHFHPDGGGSFDFAFTAAATTVESLPSAP